MNYLLVLTGISIFVIGILGSFFLYRLTRKLIEVIKKILVNQEEIKHHQQQLNEQLNKNQEQLNKNQEQLYNYISENVYALNLRLESLENNYDPAIKYLDNLRRKQIRQDNLGQNYLISYKDRSVLFLHNSYYHFYYLAKSLRKRGWDAVTVSYEDPVNGVNVNYYHGEDINLYDADPVRFKQNITSFFEQAKNRFDLLHFAGDGLMSFFPENWQNEQPTDIIEWKNLGKKIAYTLSGCNSGIAQTTFAQWSALDGRIVCNTCMWQDNPQVCNDEKNLAWGKKVDTYCDLICAETVPALDYVDTNKTIFEPLSMCLDPDFWTPELSIPEEFKVKKNQDEILVYHAVGNYDIRTRDNQRNIKGTPAVMDAIERLKSEGIPVKLIFITNMKNKEVRYIQAQADIIVDQLNLGRYGATARECMMLGKPVICYINPYELKQGHQLACQDEFPLVSATEETVYDVLKDLALNQEKRLNIGQKSREYAIKWHSADACAQRYEKVYDALMAGKSLNPADLGLY
ncbi:glycosyl transferase family 1 [Cuspidothrix issatschenkoi]|uniref:Glycosyl transferase family 1 n=1 Tax=Cuspidothrix issatschenkoi CHARLIE-1 TaxID=2052836 RepID=A0A2S6CTK8_9CYAN|nr:glycosyl transferase family 1 [Cuspidothrix issatschenkoi]PPJ63032.1 glycosyl transferase family 1 [Cuspidothrix issatschenkoi CHARLIE-1]